MVRLTQKEIKQLLLVLGLIQRVMEQLLLNMLLMLKAIEQLLLVLEHMRKVIALQPLPQARTQKGIIPLLLALVLMLRA